MSAVSFGQVQLAGGLMPSTGKYFFVHSVTGSNNNNGAKPDKPLATIVKALTLATAAKGDTIVCMAGHTEDVIAAGTITISKSGVRIIGLGSGKARPVINYTTAAAASVDITGANVLIRNVYFRALGVDAVTAMINISAADVALEDCELETGDATNQAVLGILTTAAADRLRVKNCFFHGSADAGTATAIRIVGGDGIVLEGNDFQGNYTTTLGAIENVTTACTNCIVKGNIINNRTASSAKGMVFVSTSTGQISRNHMQILTGSAPITGAAMSWVGANYYAAVIATAGTLI
jgi:ribosomal protein L13